MVGVIFFEGFLDFELDIDGDTDSGGEVTDGDIDMVSDMPLSEGWESCIGVGVIEVGGLDETYQTIHEEVIVFKVVVIEGGSDFGD